MVRALALIALIGFVFALVPSCGPTQKARCTRANCNGCCDSETGLCFNGTSPEACGVGAVSCQVCASGQACVDGQCRTLVGGGGDGGSGADAGCGPSSCAGCCQNGECKAGNLSSACGKNGSACATCEANQTCQQGTCSSSTCAGCLDAVGNCLSGDSPNACGKNGSVCQSCFTGQSCVDGACTGGQCGPQTCPDGCCAGNTCIKPVTKAQCGANGSSCVSCQGQEECVNGACYFDGGTGNDGGFPFPDGGCTNCQQGCCVGPACIPHADQDPIFLCGTGGQACVSCINQGKLSCNNGVCQ